MVVGGGEVVVVVVVVVFIDVVDGDGVVVVSPMSA